MRMKNNDIPMNGYLSKGILGKFYQVIDKIGYIFFNQNSDVILSGKKLLFINLGLIGDLILFRYVIEDFLDLGYEIDVLIQDEYKFIFSNCDKINIITIKNYKDKKIFAGFYKIAFALLNNGKKYDISYHFRGYLGTGILSTRITKSSQYSIGFATSGFGFLLTKVVPWRLNVHETEHLLDVLRVTNIAYNSVNLNIYNKIERNQNLVTELEIIPKEYVVIHATSQDDRKNIPKPVLNALINYFHQMRYLKVVFVGASNEVDYVTNEFPMEFNSYIITNGKLSFYDLRYLIENSKCFIGIDSSIAHLIANIEVSKILLWHGLNSLVQWYPLGKNVTVIKDNNEITNLLVQIDKVCKN